MLDFSEACVAKSSVVNELSARGLICLNSIPYAGYRDRKTKSK